MSRLDAVLNQTTTFAAGYPVWYKHNQIANFRVGEFQFENHLLKIDNPELEDIFLQEYKGLMGIDQVNIKQVMNVENERPVDTNRVIRGASSTTARPAELGDGRKDELDRRDSELVQREAVVAQRETELSEAASLKARIAELEAANAQLRGGPETISAAEGAPSDPMAKTNAQPASIHDTTMDSTVHAATAAARTESAVIDSPAPTTGEAVENKEIVSTAAEQQALTEDPNLAPVDADKFPDPTPAAESIDDNKPPQQALKIGGLKLGGNS